MCTKLLFEGDIILETAVRDAKLAQDLELESLCSGAGHSQVVKDRPTANDSGSRDCVKLASPTAVSRIMPDPTFSLTERCIINPILSMRARLVVDPSSSHSSSSSGIGRKIYRCMEKELFTRIIGAFASVFAAPDAFVHFFTGTYKAVALLPGRFYPVSWNGTEVRAHFKKAALFTGLTLVGSVVGVIWPGLFSYFDKNPPGGGSNGGGVPSGGSGGNSGVPPEGDGGSSDVFPTNSDSSLDPNMPRAIQNLFQQVISDKERAPFQKLHVFWKGASLTGKQWFVNAFNHNHTACGKVRALMPDIVYRSITPKRNVVWLNQKESSDKDLPPSYFHATSKVALEAILKTGRIEVRHQKAYRGAFVSTLPELGFGNYILGFNRNIERLSALEHGFTIGQDTFWAGFSRNIPVSQKTLACVILNSESKEEREALEAECVLWTGRKIEVLHMRNIHPKLDNMRELGFTIPFEWIEEGEKVGHLILSAMHQSHHVPPQSSKDTSSPPPKAPQAAPSLAFHSTKQRVRAPLSILLRNRISRVWQRLQRGVLFRKQEREESRNPKMHQANESMMYPEWGEEIPVYQAPVYQTTALRSAYA